LQTVCWVGFKPVAKTTGMSHWHWVRMNIEFLSQLKGTKVEQRKIEEMNQFLL
jgi:hypothetical protein